MTEPEMAVISPLGNETIGARTSAPRPDTLNGKTICEMWNGDFKGNFTFPIIRELLHEQFKDVRIVPYTAFPNSTIRGTPAHQREVDSQMIALAKAQGCDAVIAGNGG
ncbi:MAG: hypothetical protein O2967_14065 [Proteobacteria bacterium]|nr:hypothetical protein [Pseudomonadota bacterium]